jgi:toxin CcdB
VKIDGEEYVAVFPLIAAVPRSSLGAVVGSLAARRADLIAALDLLITGA